LLSNKANDTVNMVNHQDDDTALICEIKDRINSDLEHLYAGTVVNMLVNKCSFLDPRFKDMYKFTNEPAQILLKDVESEFANTAVSNCNPGQNETESSEPLTKKRKEKENLVHYLVRLLLLILTHTRLLYQKEFTVKLRCICNTPS